VGHRTDRSAQAVSNELCKYFLKEITMLNTLAIVLVVLWLLGLVTSYTMGGFIHILLVVAVVVVLVKVITGRKVL
jgi:hypothetical protein